uniref:Uncharacterized protein n=1 Tax=Panagrolaimus sp. ES5 TaxID=591445 RepID=A0AC34G3K5_9BILA
MKSNFRDSTKNTVNLFVQYSPSFEQQRPRSPPLSSAKLFGLETVEEEDEPLDILPRIFTCHKCDKSGFCLNCLELHLKWSKKCGDDPLPDASSTESEYETESSDSTFTSETSGDKQFSEGNDGNESDAEKLHRIKDFVPQILPFSTGLPALDQHVMLKPGVMVTVVGGQGCGRKEFSYCTIAEALHANNSGIIFYISYKGGFNPLRLIEILHHRFGPVSEDEVQNALKRVVSPVVPQNVEGLYKWLYEFEKKYKDINVILLIVDHIGLYLWETYDSMVDYRAVGEHNQIVIYSLFQKLNQKFGILYTTHVKGWDSSKMLPAGGSIFWNKKMTTNIFLIRHVRMFQAQIYKMVDMKRYISTSRVFTFYLSRKGITNSQFESQEEPSEWWKYAPKSPESNGLNRTELWERFNNMFEHSDNDAG